MMNLVKNLKWGLRWGLTVAVGFTVIGALASTAASFDPTPRNDPSLLSFVGFYFLGGTAGGLLLGLLRPITEYKAGAIFVGTSLAAVSIALLARIFVITDGWTMVDTVLVALYSVVAGPIATLMIWEVRARRSTVSSNRKDPKP